MEERADNIIGGSSQRSRALSRREFCRQSIATAAAAGAAVVAPAAASEGTRSGQFALNYIVGSPMYGTTPLAEVLAEVPRAGARVIDIWPRHHANHREQMDDLGHDRVARLFENANVRLGAITRYDLGPYRLPEEMPVLARFGGKILVCGARPQPGDTLKERLTKFVASLHDQVAAAEKHDIKIGIENHGGSLLDSPDAIRYFADAIETTHLGLAMAPYHLPQDPALIADLVEHLGDKLVFFQAWQHGKGCMKKLPKEEELLQMPGRGPLDFRPILAALKRIDYQGWTEIFMHPVPRGIPILPTTQAVTAEINRARAYLEGSVRE